MFERLKGGSTPQLRFVHVNNQEDLAYFEFMKCIQNSDSELSLPQSGIGLYNACVLLNHDYIFRILVT